MAQPGAASPPLLGRAFISGPSFRAWYGPSGPDVPITQLSYDHSQAFVRLTTPLARSAWSAHPGGREVLNRGVCVESLRLNGPVFKISYVTMRALFGIMYVPSGRGNQLPSTLPLHVILILKKANANWASFRQRARFFSKIWR